MRKISKRIKNQNFNFCIKTTCIKTTCIIQKRFNADKFKLRDIIKLVGIGKVYVQRSSRRHKTKTIKKKKEVDTKLNYQR